MNGKFSVSQEFFIKYSSILKNRKFQNFDSVFKNKFDSLTQMTENDSKLLYSSVNEEEIINKENINPNKKKKRLKLKKSKGKGKLLTERQKYKKRIINKNYAIRSK